MEKWGDQIGLALSSLEHGFLVDRPDAVVVQGDTNSTVAAALASNAHEYLLSMSKRAFEASTVGCLKTQPGHNDHLADLCLAPTPTAWGNLTAEGIP